MPPRWFMLLLSAAHKALILVLLLAIVTAVAYAVAGIGWLFQTIAAFS